MTITKTARTNGSGGTPNAVTSADQLPMRRNKKKTQRPRATRRELMLDDLKRSGLTEKDAKKLGCKPKSAKSAKSMLGLRNINLPDGYEFPYYDVNKERIYDASRWRALGSYTQRNRQSGKRESGPKYRQRTRSKPRLYFCPLTDWSEVDGTIVITEGEKKAACACKAGIRTVGIGGVWNWRKPKSDDELLPDFADVLYEGAKIEICFDSDVQTNPNVRQALARLAAALEKKGCNVQVVHLPSGSNDEKIGLDDFLVEKGRKQNGKFSSKRARRAFKKLPRSEPPEIDPITIRLAADIKPQPLRPVCPDFLYRRKVALLAGEPGLGKSLFSCDVAARVSCASDWPGGVSAVIDPSNVVMISGEDDPEDTIVPRLIAAGGDLSKIHIINDVVETRDGELSALSIDKHMKGIHAMMIRCGAVLLVFDPVPAFMGDRDSHKDTAVRALLNKVRQYAIEGDYSVLMITHFNKPGEKVSSAVHRVMGSLGFVAAARSVYAFVRDPADPDQRLFLPIKNNLGADKKGLSCSIDVDSSQNLRPSPAFLRWDDDPVDNQRIDEVLTQSSPRVQARKAKEAEIEKWLLGKLTKFRVRSKRIFKQGKKRGYAERTVRKVLEDIGTVCEQDGFHGGWAYRLMEHS